MLKKYQDHLRVIVVLVLLALALFVSRKAHASTMDSCSYYRQRCDTLSHKLYIDEKKLIKIEFYVNLCNKKPKQRVFLLGWINRALK